MNSREGERAAISLCACLAILRYHVAPPMPWHTNYVAILRMRGMGKAPANISIRKLTFLQRTAHGENDSISTKLLRTIAATDIQQLDLVQHCPMHIQLEPLLGTFFTCQICQALRSDIPPSETEFPRQMRDHVLKQD